MVITDRPSTKYQNILRWYEIIFVDILYSFQSDQSCMLQNSLIFTNLP